jgi:general secretion pathway protein H
MGKKAVKGKMLISRTGIYNDNANIKMQNDRLRNSKIFIFPFSFYNSRRYGFTLLELIVVLFIVSLVAAIVLPSFAGFGETKLKSEAREMASILRYMNDSAASRKETFLMRFDLDKNMVYWKGPDGEKTRRFDDITGVTTQSTGMVSKGEITLFFEPLGIQENIGVHMSRRDKDMTITLHHLSGRVKISEK